MEMQHFTLVRRVDGPSFGSVLCNNGVIGNPGKKCMGHYIYSFPVLFSSVVLMSKCGYLNSFMSILKEESSIHFSSSFLSFKLCHLVLLYNLPLRRTNDNKMQTLENNTFQWGKKHRG